MLQYSLLEKEHRVQEQAKHHQEQQNYEKEKHRINDIIFINLENLLKKLPHNSPIRRLLESEITRGLSVEEIKHCFSLSNIIIQWIEKERDLPKEKSVLWQQYSNMKRKRKVKGREKLREDLDDVAPMQSARTYRIVTTTK